MHILHNFINVGSYFKYGDKCSLRHLQTQRYLAMNPETKEFEVNININQSKMLIIIAYFG